MKYRLERVREVVQAELGQLIARQIRFEDCLVTIQSVDLTPDLKQAHIYVSVLGSEQATRAAMARLHAERAELQHALSRGVILKNTPHLHFKLDHTVERGNHIIDILQTLDIPEDAPEEELEIIDLETGEPRAGEPRE